MSLLFIGVAFNNYVLSVTNDDLLIRETEAAILSDIGGFKSLFDNAGRSAVIKSIESRVNNLNNDFFYYLKDKNDNFLAGNLDKWPTKNVKIVRNGILEIEAKPRNAQTAQNRKYQTVIAMILELDNKDELLVGRSVQNYELAVRLAQVSSWVMIIIVSIISILSIAVAYYVVSRINKISDTADKIVSSGNLSERLYVESEWDDLSKLTLALNQMLEKLEHSVKGIKSVSDSIAHDLRTPLTRLKTHLEALPNQDEKYQLLQECDNILEIFNSLLRITYIETSAQRSHFELNNLSVVLEDAIDLYVPVMEDKHIRLTTEISDDLHAICDKSLIFQAFANTIDNAVKFTPEQGEIAISLKRQGTNIHYSVSDSGIGVSSKDIDKLTRRFYRADKSRSTQGNGLGLSLVSAVVELHNGHLTFSANENDKGLKCSFDIPVE